MTRIKSLIRLILLLPLLQVSFAATATTPLPTPVGRVVWVKGPSLKALMPNKEQRLLQKLSIIYEHDVLTTDDKTEAEIVFTDNTLMTFRPSTKFSIDQYSFNPKKKNGSVGKYLMSVIEGGFRTITGLIAKNNPSDYQVNTPVATIGVRGTDYAVYFHNNQVYVGDYKGLPCIKNKGTQTSKELCLNMKMPYAFVANSEVVPVPLTQQPDVFKEKLEILPAVIAPFNAPQGISNSNSSNSFCISQ